MSMGDVNGNHTTVLERGYSHLKDNRIPPLGFTTTHYTYDTTQIVGEALEDPDFNKTAGVEGSGRDIVHYKIDLNGYSGQFRAIAKVHYQAVPPSWLREMREMDAPEINTFLNIYDAADKAPITIAGDSLTELVSPLLANSTSKQVVEVYPNPAASGQALFFKGIHSADQISLYDLGGKQLALNNVTYSNGTLVLRDKLSPGVYLWRIRKAGKNYTGRIVIISP
jgi:hypothetical protein